MTTFEELLIDPLLEKVKEVMSEHKNGDDPVHPIIIDDVSQKQISITGINKKELFSAMAMQGLLSAGIVSISQIPKQSIGIADALLAELSKERE